MKVRNGQVLDVVNYRDSDNKSILERLSQTRIPISQQYKVVKNIDALNKQYQDVEKLRVDLIKKYGVEKEDGSISVSQDDVETYTKFVNEFYELMNIEEELNIKMVDFEALTPLSTTLQEMQLIGFMIQFPEEPEEVQETPIEETKEPMEESK